MPYDYGLKKISKSTGLTGVEAKNIARKLKEKNIDPELFDWEGAISDAKDYGNRYKAVLQKLKDYYGADVSKEHEYKEYSGRQQDIILNDLMQIFEGRSRESKMMDLSIDAKKQFKPSNKKGVELWKKMPNQCDIIGIDNAVIDMDFSEAYNKTGMSMFGDADGDNVPNVLDCKPLDPNRDGLFGRVVNIISLGAFGQSKEAYKAEKTSRTHFERDPSGKVVKTYHNGKEVMPFEKSTDQLMREYKENQYKAKLERQKAKNAFLKQQIELRKLQIKERELRSKQKQFRGPSVAQEAIAIALGIPLQPNVIPVASRGFKQKKTHKGKSKKSIQGVNVCPRCGSHLVPVPGFLGLPSWVCPRCGVVNL